MPARMEEALKKLIKCKFDASFMSNTKWRKVFTVLSVVPLKQAFWKYVDLDFELRTCFVDESDLMDRFIGDCGLAGAPLAYRRIEWVEIPRVGVDPCYENIPHMNFEQDVDRVVSILKSTGEFELEQTERGIRIYGHKKIGI